jgi:exopolyphosphatase/guanosine-5'-triphosphate,3'-diphosphate pyrophosphatase
LRIGAIDMGSNSFHLLLVDAHPDGSFDTLLRDKEMLRLGEIVARLGTIPSDDVDRVVDTVSLFAGMAASVGATELVACATSALREADNSGAIVDQVLEETGVHVEVISGRREARLIFSAIRESIALEPGPAVCFDLGGGSLEVMVGDNAGLLWSTSVHLGAARLAAQLISQDPPSASDLREIKSRVLEILEPVAADVASFEPKLMVGTSGTFLDLARMAAASRTGAVPQSVNQLVTTRRDLQAVHDRIVVATSPQRAKLTGLDARRVDQIAAGSQLLVTAMKLFGFEELMVGEWALREGIVLDAIRRHEVAEWTNDAEAMRRASVLGLARRCNWDEGHATQVARLATTLFDQTLPLHHLGANDRALLEYAALLHDIGEHVAVDGHHNHTAYLIQHGKLRGFSPEDIAILGTLGRFHRRSDPKPSFEPFGSLPPERKEATMRLLALLRLADGLDRGHNGTVDSLDVELGKNRARLVVGSNGDMDLELWGLRRKRELFERLFERPLDIVAADHPSLAGRA